MKYFIIAGEASGDLHGSRLVKELKKEDIEADIVCWGGDLMEAEGAKLLKHYRELAIMGAWEVIKNLGKISQNLKKCKSQIVEFGPDVVILIDYPGFNLRIAEYLKNRIENVYYYISPKIWAWKQSRIKKIKEYIDRMYVIFPFEPEFYSKHDYPVKYFGNPLVETVDDYLVSSPEKRSFLKNNELEDKPIVALLAGSRVQEIRKMLPVMVKTSEYYIDYQFIIAGHNSIDKELYKTFIADSGVKVVYNQTYSLYKYCDAALVTSGTATLEAALAGVPQVVCYRTSWLTYHLAKAVLKIRFISLVNLIMDREIVKELIQGKVNTRDIVSELNIILPGGWKRDVMKNDYQHLANILEGKGASQRVAIDIFNSLRLIGNVN